MLVVAHAALSEVRTDGHDELPEVSPGDEQDVPAAAWQAGRDLPLAQSAGPLELSLWHQAADALRRRRGFGLVQLAVVRGQE